MMGSRKVSFVLQMFSSNCKNKDVDKVADGVRISWSSAERSDRLANLYSTGVLACVAASKRTKEDSEYMSTHIDGVRCGMRKRKKEVSDVQRVNATSFVPWKL